MTVLSPRFPAFLGLALGMGGCILDDAEGARPSTLLVPADIEIHWDASFNAPHDGLVAVVPVDVMVYDGWTGEPRRGVAVDVRASDAAVLLEGDLSRASSDLCAPDEPACDLLWDAVRDQYFALDEEADVQGGRAQLRTDAEGIARVLLVVDSLAAEGRGFAPAVISVSAEASDASFVILAR